MSKETDGRALAERARARMAEKARLPWWYVAVQGVAMLCLLMQPPLSHLAPSNSTWPLLGWPIAILLLVGPSLLRRTRGADVGRAPLAAYPSTRGPGIVFLVVAVAGIVLEFVLVGMGLIVPAIVLAVLLAVGCTAYQLVENAAVRRDIRDGRAVPR